ncbi:hypothetical protein BC833DRAFT_596600 [Globomyces pollinis-pini]|nr:hypothetical protein BC833DRAFT_596600 [Globomyces pollinis-pini]
MKDIFETTNNTRLLLEEQEMHLKAISSQLPKTRLLLQAMLNDIKKMDLNESKKEIPKPESLKIPRKSISKSKSAGNEGFNSNVNSDSTRNSASDDTNLSNSNNHHPSNEQNGMNSKIEKPLLKGKLVENASPFSSPKITKNKSFNNPIENESSIGSNNSESSFNSAKKNRKSLTARLSVITRNISNFSDKDIRNDSLNALKRQSITSIRNSVKLITQKLMPPTEDHLIPDYIPDLPMLKEHHIFSTNIWFKKDSQRLDSKELVDQTAELIHKVKFHSESFGITIVNTIHNIILLILFIEIPNSLATYNYQLLTFLSFTASVFTMLHTGVILCTACPNRYIDLDASCWATFRQYTKSILFVIDFLTGFPWILVQLILGGQNHYWCFLHALCIFRLFDNRKIYWWLSIKKISSKFNTDSMLVVAFKVFMCKLIYLHFAVTYHIYSENHTNSVAFGDYYLDHMTRFYIKSISKQYDKYLISREFPAWVILLNYGFMHIFQILFVTILATYLTELDRPVKLFAMRREEVHEYSIYKQQNKQTKKRIGKYYSAKFPDGRYFDEQLIYGKLNSNLKMSVKEPVLALLSQIRIFEGLDPNFLKQLCLETSSSLYLRKDIVVDIDSKMETMYMIKSGEVAIDGKLILTSGMYFGERALLIQGFKAPVTVIARTTCTLITFTRTQLEVVLERNHEVKEELHIIAKRKEQESCYDDNDKFPFDFGVFNNGVLPEVSKPFSEASINLEMYNEITPVIQSEMNDIICDMKVGPRGLHRKSLRRPSRLAEVYNGEPSLNDLYLKPE